MSFLLKTVSLVKIINNNKHIFEVFAIYITPRRKLFLSENSNIS